MTTEASPPPIAKSNPVKRLGGVVVAPDTTLREIAAAPDWLIPLALIAIVSLVTTLIVTPHLDFESMFREQMEARDVPPAQIDEQLDLMVKVSKITTPVFGLIGPVLMIVIIAGVLLLAFKLFGGEGRFKQSFAVTSYAWIPEMIKGILVTVLVARAGTLTPQELGSMLKSNLGFLADPESSRMLFSLLSSFDVFNIWTIILLAIGFAHAHKTSRAKSFAIIVVLWAVVIAVKVGFAALNLGGMS